jgi:hypothetical protein
VAAQAEALPSKLTAWPVVGAVGAQVKAADDPLALADPFDIKMTPTPTASASRAAATGRRLAGLWKRLARADSRALSTAAAVALVADDACFASVVGSAGATPARAIGPRRD